MGTSFYILMGILGIICAVNIFSLKARKKSKARTFSIWFNATVLALIIIVLATSLAI